MNLPSMNFEICEKELNVPMAALANPNDVSNGLSADRVLGEAEVPVLTTGAAVSEVQFVLIVVAGLQRMPPERLRHARRQVPRATGLKEPGKGDPGGVFAIRLPHANVGARHSRVPSHIGAFMLVEALERSDTSGR